MMSSSGLPHAHSTVYTTPPEDLTKAHFNVILIYRHIPLVGLKLTGKFNAYELRIMLTPKFVNFIWSHWKSDRIWMALNIASSMSKTGLAPRSITPT